MQSRLKHYDWEEIQDALNDYADHLEETEPHATNTIARFREAASSCPCNEDFD